MAARTILRRQQPLVMMALLVVIVVLGALAWTAQASFLARGPRACAVVGSPGLFGGAHAGHRSDFARFMAVRGGMQVRVRACVRGGG